VKLTKCQNHHHHGGVFDTWIRWAKPQDEWAQGLVDQQVFKSVWPMASWTRVYMRRGRPRRWRKAVEAVPPSWPATWLGRLADRHFVSYHLDQVGGGPPRPDKYPPPVEIITHTPHFGNSTGKALILSVVVRHSLVRRVVRL
jgi:hypothetical protein